MTRRIFGAKFTFRCFKMTAQNDNRTQYEDYAWRRKAPAARRAAITLFSWQEPGWTFLLAVGAAAPFLLAALMSPALLSFLPTVDMIAPIADARAVKTGQAVLAEQASPFYTLLLLAADLFAGAPGRIHLIAKVFGAVCVAYPLAYLVSSRFPVFVSILLVGGLAAYVVAPFASAPELGLALLIGCALAFITPSADEQGGRARFEGVLAGLMLFWLWMLSPVFSLTGFVLLSLCPFLGGRKAGLMRYAATLASFAVFAGITEFFFPGINMVRASAASGIFSSPPAPSSSDAIFGMGGIAISAIMIVAMAAVFGGREHAKNWVSALVTALLLYAAARFSGAYSTPVFVLAALIACFSVTSPFYDGLFRAHDRASVSVALSASVLSAFWASTILLQSAGQLTLQWKTARAAPSNIRSELALVQPGGPQMVQWIEEGRFSTPEARELLALAPIDQSAVLLEAAERARVIDRAGYDVTILTRADTACVIATRRECRADGSAAAGQSNVVFVPRLDLDPETTAANGRFEATLYTEFKLVERTALWEIWVRRGVNLPAGILNSASAVSF